MVAPLSGTYSFVDVQVALKAPSASFILSENGIAEEGVRIAMTAEKGILTMGADGSGMHSMRAANNGRVTVNLLKMSPINAQMSTLYRYQRMSAANWGNIQITVNNPVTGDNITCSLGAFVKQADVGYAVEGGFLIWEFNFADVDEILGNGYAPTAL